MKITYAEQLKHPEWQRRRLQSMMKANFQCEKCGAKEKTLNVHHKQYFKGRLLWEYGDDELLCLCEDCHKDEHSALDIAKKLICQLTGQELMSLLCGYLLGHQRRTEDSIRCEQIDAKVLRLGVIAHALSQMTDAEVANVYQSMLDIAGVESDAAITLFLNAYLFESES